MWTLFLSRHYVQLQVHTEHFHFLSNSRTLYKSPSSPLKCRMCYPGFNPARLWNKIWIQMLDFPVTHFANLTKGLLFILGIKFLSNLCFFSSLRRDYRQCTQDTWEGQGNPLQCFCLETPWTEEPGGLQSIVSDTTEVTQHTRKHAHKIPSWWLIPWWSLFYWCCHTNHHEMTDTGRWREERLLTTLRVLRSLR